MISVTSYVDKKNNELPKRDIYFSCDTLESRDRWVISLEFLRAKATLDQYKKNNGALHLNFNDQDDEKLDEEQEANDVGDYLYDFGDKLKSQTTMRQGSSGMLGNRMSMLKDSMAARKQSVFKNPQMERNNLTAVDLYQKLKILYNVNMLSFVYHLDQVNFVRKSTIA